MYLVSVRLERNLLAQLAVSDGLLVWVWLDHFVGLARWVVLLLEVLLLG